MRARATAVRSLGTNVPLWAWNSPDLRLGGGTYLRRLCRFVSFRPPLLFLAHAKRPASGHTRPGRRHAGFEQRRTSVKQSIHRSSPHGGSPPRARQGRGGLGVCGDSEEEGVVMMRSGGGRRVKNLRRFFAHIQPSGAHPLRLPHIRPAASSPHPTASLLEKCREHPPIPRERPGTTLRRGGRLASDQSPRRGGALPDGAGPGRAAAALALSRGLAQRRDAIRPSGAKRIVDGNGGGPRRVDGGKQPCCTPHSSVL